MSKALGTVLAIAVSTVMLVTLVADAQAAPPSSTTVACWGAGTHTWDMRLLEKPRLCFFNGDQAHAWQAPIMKMRWRSWGGPEAIGRGTYFYNQGFRAPVHFRLYRRRAWEDGLLYTAIRGVIYSPDHARPIHFRQTID